MQPSPPGPLYQSLFSALQKRDEQKKKSPAGKSIWRDRDKEKEKNKKRPDHHENPASEQNHSTL